MRRLLHLLPLMFLPLPAAAVPVPDCADPQAGCTLRQIASQAGMRLGAAAQPRFFDADPDYAPTLAREFNSLTPENQMKWPYLHPEPDVYDFADADRLVDFAEANDMRVRGHTLVWANPERLPGYLDALADADEARAVLDAHIRTVAGRYAGRVDAWDVVNEPLLNFGTTPYPNAFQRLLGTDWIAEAFRSARAAAPDATLFLNEVLIGIESPKLDAFHALVGDLLADGVPIDGVGIQMHVQDILYNPEPDVLEAVIRSFADLGLAVEITEMDIAMTNMDADRLEQQRALYQGLVGACVAVEACEGVTFWGFTDAHTWIDGQFTPGLSPLLFDEDYRPKPAYDGVRDALRARLPEPAPLLLWIAAALAAGQWRASSPRPSRAR